MLAMGNRDSGASLPFVPPKCATEPKPDWPADGPTLVEGQFTDISPPPFKYKDSSGFAITQGMSIDPCNPTTVYVCVPNTSKCTEPDCRGLFRSTNGGKTWTELGDFLDCKNIWVDPNDPLHLYQGGGTEDGFHVSYDGGLTWITPPKFKMAGVETGDVYHIEPDPTDFKHILVTFHSGWKAYGGDSGILESFDGGENWVVHPPIAPSWSGGYNVFILHEPIRKIGNSNTWLFATQGEGFFRTTDAGKTWTKVSDIDMEHGGGTIYYAKDGTLYVSGSQGVLKSKDNGATFESFVPIPAAGELSLIGDGTNLYTGAHGGGKLRYAKETDPTMWMAYNEQEFAEGPFQMALDKVHNVLFTANIRGGVWVLKLRKE